jgi:type IV pilus assembly protein PilN
MRRINLLPWREQQRRERKMAFGVGVAAALLGAVMCAVAAYLWAGAMVSDQRDRNQRLKSEIARLDQQIEEINSLEQQKLKFIARMQIIEKLQRSRPEIVHVFDTLAHMIPEGAYLTEVSQVERRLKIRGVAQSSTRVSAFMRNIDASQWLVNPELEVVETKKENSVGNDFTLYADQASITDGGVARSTPAVARAGKP